MSQPTQFEGWPVDGSAAQPSGGTKIDSFSSDTAWGGLAGNQHVAQHLTHLSEHLPSSPASGPPMHEDGFTAGHRWTEAEGKVHDHSGQTDTGW